MFDYMKGIAAEILLDKIILEVNGIGYRINSTVNTTAQVKKGEPATIFTHLAVKEDEISLYGFFSREELGLFKLLLSVSKIGPKVATSILSAYTPEKLAAYIQANDVVAISKAPGVGKKTAERIVLELKDKVNYFVVGSVPVFDQNVSFTSDQEVVEALLALGYSRLEVDQALGAVMTENDSTEEAIKKSLKWLVK